LTSLIKNVSSLKVLVTDAYFDGMKIAFAIDPQTKKYVYEAQEEKQRILNHRIFGKEKNVPVHPFLHAAILGLNCHTLRADLLPKHRDTLVQILQDTSAHSTQHVLFVWGNLDVTVPYKRNISQVKKWMEEYPKLELKEMDRMGHELLAEDSNSMADVLRAFLEKTN
jgi:pimeloyl-ACP methyl ester carboxylesterase